MRRTHKLLARVVDRIRQAVAQRPVWNVMVLVIIFNVFSAAMIWGERKAASAQAAASAGNLVAAMARDISRNIEIIDLSLQKVLERVQQPSFKSLDPDLQRLLLIDQVTTARYFAAIAVTDEAGKVVYHSRTKTPGFIQIADKAYFSIHRDRPDVGLYISVPIRSPYGYGLAIVFSRRISDGDGKFAGIAYVALDIGYFTDLFGRMNLGPNGSMSLIRADKKLLARVPFSEADLGKDVSNAAIFQHYPEEVAGSFEAESPLDGVARQFTFTQVGDFPLTVSVGRTLENVYAEWRDRAKTVGLTLVLLTGVMIALAINLRRELRHRQDAHQEAVRNEALFRGAMKGAGIASALLNLEERVIAINPAFTKLFGYSMDEVVGLPVSQLIYRDGVAPDNGPLLRGEVEFEEREFKYQHKDGRELWVQRSASLIRDEARMAAYLMVQYQDITSRHLAEEKLRYAATHDDLTGLLKRSAFEEKISEALAESRVTGIKHTLAFLDLDRLKIINDSEGHAAGDAMIKWVAAALPAYMREGDIIGRLGGDEFGVILLGCGLDDATEVLERLNLATSAIQFPWGDRSYSVGASIGLTEISSDSGSPSTLLAQADVACMAAKMSGRNRVSIYRPEQSDALERHRELSVAAGIRQAVQENRFCLFAQRIVGCDGDRHRRYEILVRMTDKDGNPIQPGLFIPAAERYELIGEIDRWVVRHALREVSDAALADPQLRIHVNLSAASIGDPLFLDYLLAEIERSGVPAQALVFEITETALISQMAVAETLVRKLRAIGCQIALDDFGSGLSSFQYLRQFPVDIVKIDGSFVRSMIENGVDLHIVKSIHQIASELGAQTVAEYIENGETLLLAYEIGISFAQGYAIHKPEPFDDILANLKEEEAFAESA